MFTVEERDRVKERVLELAREDPRVVAGATLGSLALGGDRLSDLDLGFGLADGAAAEDVLDDWRQTLEREFDAVVLFDWPSGASLYRVFLFPGCLQVDLSATPAAEFRALGPAFSVLFGSVAEPAPTQPAEAAELLGFGVHHAVRARFCIERGRVWEAQYWVAGVRDEALGLACRRRELPTRWGRGYDKLPPEVLTLAEQTLVRSLERAELLRALSAAVDLLFREASEAPSLAARVEAPLRELVAADEL